MYENVFEDVKDLLKTYLCLDAILLLNSTKLNSLGIDSMDLLEVVIMLEDHYDITIENAHSIITFGNLVEMIVDRLEDKKDGNE
jgi:acyl carrier protein